MTPSPAAGPAAGKRKEAGTIIASSGRIKLTIDSVTPDGAATGTLVYEWITINITGPDGTTKKNDSRSSGEIPPLQNLIQSIAGEPITVTFNAEGEATGLSGLDNIESKLENKKAMPQKRDFLETARILMGIPDAPAQASVGTRWSEQFTGSHQMGSMDYDTTWTLDSVGQLGDVPIPVASISGQSRMTLDVDRSKMPANAPPVQVQMTNSENQSQIWFDLQLGEIVGRNNVSTNTVTASMSVGTQTLTQTTTERSTEQFLRVAE